MELFTTTNLIALATLTALEVVLGIDNVVFLSILAGKLPKEQQGRARQIGLLLAMGMRIGLLLAISWVMGLTKDLFAVFGEGISGRDLILLAGGLFLIGKATFEVHDKLEGGHNEQGNDKQVSFRSVIIQVVILDAVFSLDSVITAVGMVDELAVMITAVVIAVGVMLVFAKAIGHFVEEHPTIKMLALSFLILVGVLLVAEGLDKHINRGYVYFAMAFSLLVELLNIRARKKSQSQVSAAS